jgi:tyrosinase
LEQALQTIVPDVAMPYWDETAEETLKEGIPSILTQEQFELDGELIDNPLRSFTLPAALLDDMSFPSEGDTDHIYEKPKGYQTVRYPLSGLVGTAEARAATATHNAQYPDQSENTRKLNQNVKGWLHGAGSKPDPSHDPGPTPSDPNPKQHGVYWQFKNCLHAPNYTVFSNTTSAQQWNLDHSGKVVVSLEQPHNDVHLSVGGFDVSGQESGQIAGANGDMGENNTAALDPIFFFHHCNVDRMFWLWQKQHCGKDGSFTIITNYAGTNSSDSQGPTPGIPPGTPLGLDTPLNPFLKDEFGTPYTSKDCFDIDKLGYTYAPGSLEKAESLQEVKSGFSRRNLTVRGIDPALFQGSFVLRAYATVRKEKGETLEYYLGHYSVLSRRNVVHCANCLTHLEVVAHFSLSNVPAKDVDKAEFRVEIQQRGQELPVKLKYTVEVND